MDNQTAEVKFLFKHLLLFLLVGGAVRIWNMAFFVSFPWSQFIIIPWIALLAVHLILFFMSTGVLGSEYENVPVRSLAGRLFNKIKERNSMFKKNMIRPTTPPTNSPN